MVTPCSTLLAAGWACILVFMPQPLVAELAGRSVPIQRSLFGVLILTTVGFLESQFLPVHGLAERLALTLAGMTALALAYFDARLFVIPDLYVGALTLFGLGGPLGHDLGFVLSGAVIGGGLLGMLYLVWRYTTGSEGLGVGDIKLAAGLGVLLGPQNVLRAICMAALLGVGIGVVMHRHISNAHDGPVLIPLGATLSLAGVGFLYWNALT